MPKIKQRQRVVLCVKIIREDSFVRQLVFDSPIRQMVYFSNGLINKDNAPLLIDILNDKNYIKNTFKFLMSFTKKKNK